MSFYSTHGVKGCFSRISIKNRCKFCIFFEAERAAVLKKIFGRSRKGAADDTPIENLRLGDIKKFVAGLSAVVKFSGVPENRVRINGDLYLKIKIATTEVDVYCYSQIEEEKCLCLEIVSE